MPTAPQPLVHYSGTIIDSKGRVISGGYLTFKADTRPANAITRFEIADIDSSGSFRVDLYPGSYHVRWENLFTSGVYDDNQDTGRTIAVSAEHPTLEWIVDGILVRGAVLDPSGAPLDSVGVYAASNRFDAWTRTVQGGYELLLSPDTYSFSVSPRYASGLPGGTFGPFSVATDTTIDFQLTGVELTGTVRGPASNPLSAAAVEALGTTYSLVQARTDGSGAYRMYLKPQAYRFMIRPAETWILPHLTPQVTIATAGSMDFDLTDTQWTGLVVRSDTAIPVPDAKVRATLVADSFGRYAEATTDAAGQFRLHVEPGREYELVAKLDPLESAVLSRMAGADTSFALEILVPAP
jgi:hypothetical protein